MAHKKKETTQLYLIIDSENNLYIRKYLIQVEALTGLLVNTLSKYFKKNKKPYIKGAFTIHKVQNVDLKGAFKNNFN